MKNQSIGFIGGGRITRIILQALKNAQVSVNRIAVFDPQEAVLTTLKERFSEIEVSADEIGEAACADIVFLAVHPPVLMETLGKINTLLRPEAILISLAPKITIQKMQEALGGHPSIARINPSASSIINEGLNPVCFAQGISESVKQTILDFMKPLGASPEVPEQKIEAYAMISAMGPTYFWPQIQRLKELAIQFGMEEAEAESVITDMLWGTTETLFNSGLSYEEVMDLVPVKPLAEVEPIILGYYNQYLTGLFNKIKP